jgi:hypothetical protein
MAAYKQKELRLLLNDSLVSMEITCEGLLNQVPGRDSIPGVKEVLVLENDRVRSSIFDARPAARRPFAPLACGVDDECAILFTSG